MSKNPVVHFEMPYKDANRVAVFYEKVFGWKMNKYGEEMGNYIVAHTAETDDKGMVKDTGAINGGFYDLNMSGTSTAPSVVISVPDLKAAMEAIKAGGGNILRKPQNIPGVGLWASFEDTEGNRVSLLEATNS